MRKLIKMTKKKQEMARMSDKDRENYLSGSVKKSESRLSDKDREHYLKKKKRSKYEKMATGNK